MMKPYPSVASLQQSTHTQLVGNPRKKNNPRTPMSPAEAEAEFRRLVQDRDPGSLDVALDVLEEAGLTLKQVSERWLQEEGDTRLHTRVAVLDIDVAYGLFVLEDTEREFTDVQWTIMQHASRLWEVSIEGYFHSDPWQYDVPVRYDFRRDAIERAVVDAWFAVHVMRRYWIDSHPESVIAKIRAGARGAYDQETLASWRPPPQSVIAVHRPSKRYQSAQARANPHPSDPKMSRSAAFVEFRDLIREPDPAAMKIAEDIALEHQISLVELSEAGANASHGHFTLSPSDPADAPLYRVVWEAEPVRPTHSATGKVMWSTGYMYVWNSISGIVAIPSTNRMFNDPFAARRAAAADAWALAKRMKYLMVAHPDWLPSEVEMDLVAELTRPDYTAPELYQRRPLPGIRGKKPPTFLQARDDIMADLRRAGWKLTSPALKIPHATSPNGVLRLWFRPQAVHATVVTAEGMLPSSRAERHRVTDARAISYDLDIRKITPTEFLDLVKRRFPRGFR